MNDQVLMNDAAARSPTGEILDQQIPTTPTTTPLSGQTVPDLSTTTPAPDAPAAETKPTPSPTDAPSVPDKYEFKAPDNYTLDPTAYEAAIPVFKELGLTNDQAQKLIDIQVQREIALAKAPEATMNAMRKDWQGKTLSDPEIKATIDKNSGKTGIDAVKINLARTLAVLPVDLQVEFKDAMNLTGAGDHPAFIKAFNRLAAYVTEGSHVAGKGPSVEGQIKPGTNVKPSPAQALYPNNP
jgi:hypothetical protein